MEEDSHHVSRSAKGVFSRFPFLPFKGHKGYVKFVVVDVTMGAKRVV
jgi:hypothetical protein